MKSVRLKVLILSAPGAENLLEKLKSNLEGSGRQDVVLHRRLLGDGGLLSAESILEQVSQIEPGILILVIGPALVVDPKILGGLRPAVSRVPTLALVSPGRPQDVIPLLRLGVSGFITPALCEASALPRALQLLRALESPTKVPIDDRASILGVRRLIGEDPGFLYEVEKIPFVAESDSSVLILGETGTGKELFARAIHEHSPRCRNPFIAVNCGAIPIELAESELFGHQKGAFTGAVTSEAGLIAEAHQGTLFLDEVHSLPPLIQTKLLRFLESKEYRPVGSSKLQRVEVRVIAAANIELHREVEEGRFRRDLYYRLNVLPFVLPPLRERRGDIPQLANHFLALRCRKQGAEEREFSANAIEKLMMHHWPGNVRELFNVIERSMVMSKRQKLEAHDIALQQGTRAAADSFHVAKAKAVQQFEVDYVERLLQVYRGNISHAAQAARKHRRAFWELIRKHRIDVERFKAVQ